LDFDNTILIVTADHGENLGEAGRWGHLHVIDDLLTHIPLIIRYPRQFPAGTRMRGLCQLVDVPATIDELVGREPLKQSLGQTLVPGKFSAREVAVAELSPLY